MNFLYDYFPVVFVAAIVSLLGLLIWVTVEDSKRWEAFRVEHKCKIVAHVSGSTSTAIGFSTSGNMTVMPITTPEKTGWLCDNGVTYYR